MEPLCGIQWFLITTTSSLVVSWTATVFILYILFNAIQKKQEAVTAVNFTEDYVLRLHYRECKQTCHQIPLHFAVWSFCFAPRPTDVQCEIMQRRNESEPKKLAVFVISAANTAECDLQRDIDL